MRPVSQLSVFVRFEKLAGSYNQYIPRVCCVIHRVLKFRERQVRHIVCVSFASMTITCQMQEIMSFL